MVRPTPDANDVGPKRYTGKHSAAALAEEMRALLGMFEGLKGSIARWHEQVKDASDDTMVAVGYFYQDLCRDLDRRLFEFKEAARGEAAVDLRPVREAREILAALSAWDPVDVLESIKDVRAGRFVPMEKMRSELRDQAH